MVLGALLQALEVVLCLLRAANAGSGFPGGVAVGLDGLLAVRRQLGLPVGLAQLVLVDQVVLVSVHVVGLVVVWRGVGR